MRIRSQENCVSMGTMTSAVALEPGWQSNHLGNMFKNRGSWVGPPGALGRDLPGRACHSAVAMLTVGPDATGPPWLVRAPSGDKPQLRTLPAHPELSGRHQPCPARQSRALLCHTLSPGRSGDLVQPTAHDLGSVYQIANCHLRQHPGGRRGEPWGSMTSRGREA